MSTEDRLRDILRYGQIAVSLAYAQRRDDVWRLALERSLFLIGEAASALPREIRQAIDQPWPAIIGLRNLLAQSRHRTGSSGADGSGTRPALG